MSTAPEVEEPRADASLAVPPRGYYYGWNIVALTAMSQAASYGIALNCLSLYIPNWSRDLGVPVSVLTFCYTVTGVGFCLLGPLAGAMADKRSVRIMMTLGLLGVAALFALASQVTHAWQLIGLFATVAPVAMILAGVLPSQLLVSRWFQKRRGVALGFSTMGQTLAGAILPPVLGIILPLIGWRSLFLWIAAFLVLICAPVAFLLLRDWPTNERGVATELSGDRAGGGAAVTQSLTTREILSRRNFWVLLLASVMANFMSAGVSVNIAPLMLSRNFTIVEAGTLISALSLGALGYKLAAGYAIDRFNGRAVLLSILLTGIAGVIVLRFAHGYPVILLGVLLVAGCAGFAVPVATLLAREFGAASFGRAMGLILFAGAIAVFAPPIVAFMREATQSYDAPMLVLALVGTAAAIVASFFRDPKAPASSVTTTRS